MAGFEWDALLHPRGSLPPAVYWLRRGAVGLVVLVIVVVIAVVARPSHKATSGLSSGPGTARHSSGPATPPLTTPAATTGVSTPASAGASTTASSMAASSTAAANAACGAGVQLMLTSSASAYPAGTAPSFTATLKNAGGSCTVATPLSILVQSGSDRIWSSSDCVSAGSAGAAITLPAGETTTATRSWQRTRTLPGCAAVDGSKTAAAGTYRATATWGALSSPEVVFTLS